MSLKKKILEEAENKQENKKQSTVCFRCDPETKKKFHEWVEKNNVTISKALKVFVDELIKE